MVKKISSDMVEFSVLGFVLESRFLEALTTPYGRKKLIIIN